MPRLLLALAMAVAALAQPPAGLAVRIGQLPVATPQREIVARALSVRDYARVAAVLAEVAAADPPHAREIRAVLGAVEFLRGRMDLAVAAFRDSDSDDTPLGAEDRFTLAMALVRLRRNPEARIQLDRLRREHTSEPLYLYWLARIDYDQRRYEEALAKYRSVIQQNPNFSRAYDGLGLTLDMLGRLTEAREVLTTAVALNRNAAQPSAWPPENLGYLLLRLGELQKAEEALREALRYDPRLAICHYHLARVLEKEHLEPAAIQAYRAASSLDSSFAEPCYALGLLYRRLHRPREASAAMAEFRRRKSTP